MAIYVEIIAAARFEFDEAFDWYAERSPRVAIGFAAEVDAAIEKIGADPERFPKTYADCQRCMLNHYPYSVIYYRTFERIVIVAIAHAKRRPAYWRSRM
jgi:plasmid stabilization system protein ParE